MLAAPRWVAEAVVALLPEAPRTAVAGRYELDVKRGTFTGGLSAVLGGGVAWFGLLVRQMQDQLAAGAGAMRDTGAAAVGSEASPFGFAASPVALLLAYAALAGAVRVAHVTLHGEPLGDPLLALVAAFRSRPQPAPGPGGSRDPASRVALPPAEPRAGPDPVGLPTSRLRIDAGEEATIFEDGTAVIVSLGSLPFRVRRPAEGVHERPLFPGTAVTLGGARWEVVAEEARPTGFRYALEPWPPDHVLRQGVEYGPRLVRRAQRERLQVVDVERAQRWSWLLYPVVGLLPETRQRLACERLGLDPPTATLSGAMLEAMSLVTLAVAMTSPLTSLRVGEGLGFHWVERAGLLLGPTLMRAFGALAFGEVGGSLLLGFAFDLAQALTPSPARYDTSVLPLTREAFWARLALPDRHERHEDGSVLVRSLLPHLGWGRPGASARIPAGTDWWSVAVMAPTVEKGRLTYVYRLVPSGPDAEVPDLRHYQREVLAAVRRQWDDFLLAGSALACLLPEEVQERAYGPRGGPSSARVWTLVTAGAEVVVSAWFLRPTLLDLLTAGFLLFDGGRRLRAVSQGRYAPSLLGGLVSDYVPPERDAYHAHLAAEREARPALRRR